MRAQRHVQVHTVLVKKAAGTGASDARYMFSRIYEWGMAVRSSPHGGALEEEAPGAQAASPENSRRATPFPIRFNGEGIQQPRQVAAR